MKSYCKSYCLAVSEIAQLVDALCNGTDVDQSNILFGAARNWEVKLVCMSVLFARVLEKGDLAREDRMRMIDRVFTIDREMHFEIQHSDERFVAFMLSHVRDESETLEEALICLQHRLDSYDYASAIRC